MSANLFPCHYSCGESAGDIDSRALDHSLRLPVLALFGSAIHWLVIAGLF